MKTILTVIGVGFLLKTIYSDISTILYGEALGITRGYIKMLLLMDVITMFFVIKSLQLIWSVL